MASLNYVILVGNLTRDPEIRYVQSGNAVTKFGLAVNRRTKQGDDTTFVDIVAWDNGSYTLAQTCNTYLRKGSSVLVEGRLVIRSYDDKEGNKRKATEVVIDQMQMLDRKADGGGGNGGGNGGGERSSRPATTGGAGYSGFGNSTGGGAAGGSSGGGADDSWDDEIPFDWARRAA